MNKQIINFTKVLLIIFSIVLFNVNNKCKAAEKVQIKWYMQLSNDELDPYTVGLNRYVELYNNSQDRIELVIVPSYAGCSFDATDTLLMYIDEGNSPDIISYRYSELWEHLLDLTPYLSSYDLSNVDSAYFFKYKINNCLLYVNLSIAPYVLYYNKDLFDSAGIAYPPHEYGADYADGGPWDINKFEEIAMKLTLDSADRNALDENFDNTQIKQYGFHWEWSNGLSFINSFGFPGIVNSDSVVSVPDYMREGYKWSHDAIWKKHFIPSLEVFESMNYDPLGSNKVAMSFHEPNNDTINWDIAVMPSYNGELHLPWADIPFGIINTCEYPEEALEVIFTIANTVDFYGSSIPVFKNLRPAAFDSLVGGNLNVDWQVLYDGLNQIENVNSNYAQGVLNNMAAWRLANGMRDYIFENEFVDIDGALDTYFIPRWEAIFKTTTPVDIPSTEIDFVKQISDQDQSFSFGPNPVTNHTVFNINLQELNFVKLTIFNLQGTEVEVIYNGECDPGNNRIYWQNDNLINGIYFIMIQIGNAVQTKKIIIL